MRYSGAYAVVLALHLLTVAFLIGPAAVAAVTSSRHVRSGQVDALRAAARGTRVYGNLTVLTALLGAAMIGLGDVGEQWSWGQAWVSASLALWLVGSALLLALVAPAQQRAVTELEEGRDAGHLAGRVAAGAGLAVLAWAVVVVLMVTKPGA